MGGNMASIRQGRWDTAWRPAAWPAFSAASAAACGNYGQIRENITNDRFATKAYCGQ
jgi:hypothetical protein